MGTMHKRCGATNMFEKLQDHSLNIIVDDDISNNNHRSTSNVKEKIQRWITMFPITQELKNRFHSNEMKMLSKLLKQQAQNIIEIRGCKFVK